MPNVVDDKSNTEVLGISSIALSMVYVGTCNMEVTAPPHTQSR